MCKEKTPGELLAEELFYRTTNAGEELDAAELARADAFCEEYKTFLDHAKIEREAVRTTVAMLEKAGYTAFDPDRSYQPVSYTHLDVYKRQLSVAAGLQHRHRRGAAAPSGPGIGGNRTHETDPDPVCIDPSRQYPPAGRGHGGGGRGRALRPAP